MEEEIRKAIAALGLGFEEFKAANDARLKEVEARGSADVVVTEKVDRIDNAVEEMQGNVDALNARLEAASRLGDDFEGGADQREYAAEFEGWFRRGGEARAQTLAAAQSRAFRAEVIGTADDTGGYLAPNEWNRRIIENLHDVSPLRQLCSVRTVGVGSYKELIDNEGATSGWVGEGAARTETNTPTLAEVEFNVAEIYAEPVATDIMLADAVINIEQWLADSVLQVFVDQESAAFVTGDGANKPRGLLSYVAGGASASSNPLGVIGEVSAASATAIEADELLDLTYDLPAKYSRNASFVMARSTFKTIRKLKTTDGQYLWQPGLQAGQPAAIDGKPVYAVEEMPAAAASQLPILYGDFGRAYQILDRQGVRILRNPYKTHGKVHFYTTKRVGGAMRDPRALRGLRMAAA